MTGADFSLYIDEKIDAAYSAYFDNTKKNRLIRESIYRAAERKYLGLETQKEFDELLSFFQARKVVSLINGGGTSSLLYLGVRQITSVTYTAGPNSLVTVTMRYPHYLTNGQSIITSGILGITSTINGSWSVINITSTTFQFQTALTFTGTHTANSGTITCTNMLTNYYHYLTAKGKIDSPATTITNVKVGTTTVITSANHNVRVGDTVTISGVVGVTGINSSFTVSAVYSSSKFGVPASTSGTYVSGGTATRSNYNYLKQLRADQKAFVYTNATVDFPKWEMSDGIMFFYPNTISEVTIDYITKLPHEIDVADTVIDIEIYYPPKFLYYIADQIALNAGGQMRDGEIQNTEAQAIASNP